jgi:hypothetical protein
MIAVATIFADAERRLIAHVQTLCGRLDAGEDVWAEYLPAVTTLRALIPPERQPLATTAQLAEQFQVAPRTVRRKGRQLGLEAVRLGKRGTGAIRWRSA